MLLPGPLPMYPAVGPLCSVSAMLQGQNARQKKLGEGNASFGSQFLRTCRCTEVWEYSWQGRWREYVSTHGMGQYD